MNINSENTKEFLAKALFADKWEEYQDLVVNKQGNLANPQQTKNVSTFFLYWIRTYEKRTVNSSYKGKQIADVVVTLSLQGVGLRAEEFMQTTLFWDQRSDIRDLLSKLNATLLESPRLIVSVPYFQDGANSIFAYETVFKLSCTLILETVPEPMPSIELNGNVTIPN